MTAQLAEYLARLGLEHRPAADAEGLATLQRAHRRAIAFENLDILLGLPIRIDGASVFDKLVTRRRGGYCFEQNRLYADMLALLGFDCRPLLARVRLSLPSGAAPARSHQLLLVRIGGRDWIADAGFGGSFVPPLPLEDGAQRTTPDGASHRLRHIGRGAVDGDWLLERSGGQAQATGDWQPQYTFDLSAVAQDDLEQANHWTATWPESRFVAQPFLSIVLPDGFASMIGAALTITHGGASDQRLLADREAWREAVAATFGLRLEPSEVAQLPLMP